MVGGGEAGVGEEESVAGFPMWWWWWRRRREEGWDESGEWRVDGMGWDEMAAEKVGKGSRAPARARYSSVVCSRKQGWDDGEGWLLRRRRWKVRYGMRGKFQRELFFFFQCLVCLETGGGQKGSGSIGQGRAGRDRGPHESCYIFPECVAVARKAKPAFGVGQQQQQKSVSQSASPPRQVTTYLTTTLD
ncbi:hypothetical protein DM02DRAFT_173901 [Periconia macrospinosa]|uniref:Uncharacterized protein n=1 Tax=Periconia macrospinosa TaxID=97972 RepID=A0A2V1DBF1_9PLEO|nr:hypothetical protein DM02DRAFT_173901 [Periconia macrospinosa]